MKKDKLVEEVKKIISHYGIFSKGERSILYDEIHTIGGLPEDELVRNLIYFFRSSLLSAKKEWKVQVIKDIEYFYKIHEVKDTFDKGKHSGFEQIIRFFKMKL